VQLKTIQLGTACASAQSCPAGLGWSPRAVLSGSCCFHRNNWARPWITTIGARLLLCEPRISARPVVTSLGFDPVWSGVIIVMTVDLGLIGSRLGWTCLSSRPWCRTWTFPRSSMASSRPSSPTSSS